MVSVESETIVSICMITYNHENYIAEAINSILMQEVDFKYEVVVGEDYSTDNTRQLLMDYAVKYPGKFKLLLHDKNIGMMANFKNTLEACKGKYIALLEGDDYWTDENKLQKQVNFLEENQAYAMCFHKANVIYQDNSTESHLYKNLIDRDYSGIEIYEHWLIPTASVVFQKKVLFSNSYKKVQQSRKLLYGDTPLFLSASIFGKIYGFSRIMSAYRIQNGGVTTNYVNDLYNVCFHYIEIANLFGKEYLPCTKQKVSDAAIVRFFSLFKNGNIKEAMKFLLLAFRYAPLYSIRKFFVTLKNIRI